MKHAAPSGAGGMCAFARSCVFVVGVRAPLSVSFSPLSLSVHDIAEGGLCVREVIYIYARVCVCVCTFPS